MFSNIYSIIISVLASFLVYSVQSMEKKVKYHACYEDQFFKGYGDIEEKESLVIGEVFNESSIYFSLSDSECFDDTEKKIDDGYQKSTLYASLLLTDLDNLDDTKADDTEKKKEAARLLDDYIQENFVMIPSSHRKITEVERPKPDKNLFNIVDDYQNPSPNALPINPDKEIITTPVTFAWFARANDMVSWASDKLLPVADYVYELNKDINAHTKF